MSSVLDLFGNEFYFQVVACVKFCCFSFVYNIAHIFSVGQKKKNSNLTLVVTLTAPTIY